MLDPRGTMNINDSTMCITHFQLILKGRVRMIRHIFVNVC
jgi:hypothetical protein